MFKKIVAAMVILMFTLMSMGCGSVTKSKPGEAPKLARIIEKGSIAGVCAGIAYWTGTPTWIWRAGFAGAVLLAGFGAGIYIILWVFMPVYDQVPDDYDKRTS